MQSPSAMTDATRPPRSAPAQVQYAVHAGNSIQNKPYRRGGGHGSVEDNAYDCSGSVSYVLIKAGLLRSPLPSSGFANYGLPGPCRYITIYVKPGDHVFMTVCGLRMDTPGGRDDEAPAGVPSPGQPAASSCATQLVFDLILAFLQLRHPHFAKEQPKSNTHQNQTSEPSRKKQKHETQPHFRE